MKVNWLFIIYISISSLPAVIALILNFCQHNADRNYELKKDELRAKQDNERLNNQHNYALKEHELQHQLNDESLKLEKSFEIAKTNRELVYNDLNNYISSLDSYFDTPNDENFSNLIKSEERILLFLGEEDGLHIINNRQMLPDVISRDKEKAAKYGDSYSFVIDNISTVLKYKSQLGLETYKQ